MHIFLINEERTCPRDYIAVIKTGSSPGYVAVWENISTLIRIILLVLFFAGGIGLIAYIIAWIIIPTAPVGYYHDQEPPVTPEKDQKNKSEGGHTRLVLGIIFIIVGILFGLDQSWYGCGFLKETMRIIWRYLIPVVLIIAGVYLITREKRAQEK